MKTRSLPPVLAAGAALLLLAGGAAGAGSLELAPRFAPGDAYALSLRAETDTRAVSRGGDRDAVEETVTLVYRASVLVLEVDAQGQPVRERHAAVALTAERPEGTASLFGDDTVYEVRREEGAVRLFAGGARVDRKVEAIVADVLATQFEHTTGPALLAPDGPVRPGASWNLDPDLARRFLREHGVRALRLDGAPTATLREAGAAGARVLAYRIPVAWLEIPRVQENARTGASAAVLEGEIHLPAEAGAPRRHVSRLALQARGTFTGPVGGASTPWRVERESRTDQLTRVVRKDEIAAHGGLPPAMQGLSGP